MNFLTLYSDSRIIIHNANFDVGFINSELDRCKISGLNENRIVDTLQLAKKDFWVNLSVWIHCVGDIILICQIETFMEH